MAITGLHHFNLRVPEPELKRAARFYTEVLGLRVGPRPLFGSRGIWLYARDVPLLHLTEMNTGETVAPGAPTALPDLRDRICALDHIALACENRALMEERLKGHHVQYRVTEVPSTAEVQLSLRDPCGVGIELIFPRPAATPI